MPVMRLSSDGLRHRTESLRRPDEKFPFVPGPGFAGAAKTIGSWEESARAAEEAFTGTSDGLAARLGGASVALRLMNRSIYSGRMDYLFGLGTYRGLNRTIRVIGTASQYDWDGRKFIHFDAIVGKPISYVPGLFDAGDLVRKVREWAEGSNRVVEVDPSVAVSGPVVVRDAGKMADRPESYLAVFFLKPGDTEKIKLEQLFYS